MARMKWERAALLVLLLGSCGKRVHWTEHSAEEAYDLADTAQANARTALRRLEEVGTSSMTGDLGEDVRRLSSRVDDLERKVRDLEYR